MILTDEEMRLIAGPRVDYFDHAVFGRAIEAAILEKLASAELPEPQELNSPMDERAVWGYTADQLRQAYAQGAAAQLSAEPIGEFEALPDPTVGELPWLNIYDAKSRVVGTKLYTRRQAND